MTKEQAAAYCGLSPRGFEEWVRTGMMPRAMRGTHRWDKLAVDRALDMLSAGEGVAVEPAPLSDLEKFKVERAKRKAEGG